MVSNGIDIGVRPTLHTFVISIQLKTLTFKEFELFLSKRRQKMAAESVYIDIKRREIK